MLRGVLHGDGGCFGSTVRPIDDKEETKQRRIKARSHIEQLIASLFEALLRVEEHDEHMMERLVTLKRTGNAQILAIITVISAFCEVIKMHFINRYV